MFCVRTDPCVCPYADTREKIQGEHIGSPQRIGSPQHDVIMAFNPNSIAEGLLREIELRQKQYEYYRDMLLSFPKPEEGDISSCSA